MVIYGLLFSGRYRSCILKNHPSKQFPFPQWKNVRKEIALFLHRREILPVNYYKVKKKINLESST